MIDYSKKLRLVVFDVDGTLAEHGKPLERKVVEKIRFLEEKKDTNIKICLASGKNISYLLGLARGIGLEKPLVIGENGCIFLDAERMNDVTVTPKIEALSQLQDEIQKKFRFAIWLQPNKIALTIVFKNSIFRTRVTQAIKDFINKQSPEKKLRIYEHTDSVDVLPEEANKGKALIRYIKSISIPRGEIIAIGDSENDIPLLEIANIKIVIGKSLGLKDENVFKTIHKALDHLNKTITIDKPVSSKVKHKQTKP